jgi:hypothetical protein
MKIVMRKPTELIGAEYNPRELTDKQYRDLKDSLQRFGFVDPILVNKHKDRDNIIVGGHQRTRVAEDLGIKEVPTVEVNLTLDQEKELNIRLNKNSGQWDMDALANYFDSVELVEWGFDDSELVGFVSDEDIDAFGEDFDLPQGDKEPFQQMTFTLADEQHTIVKNALDEVKMTDNYKYIETYGNENSNANALYTIITEWAEQKK